eukprot:1158452-Pelagomonas_calceolata.AAC.4
MQRQVQRQCLQSAVSSVGALAISKMERRSNGDDHTDDRTDDSMVISMVISVPRKSSPALIDPH